MRVYIDEGGLFLPPKEGQPSFSLVLGLMIPTSVESELFYEFLRLRDEWPTQAVEIKGSTLDERQAAQVIRLASRYGCLVEFYALDMADHPAEVADDFKDKQAAAIVANLTPEHHQNIVRELREQERVVRNLPNQLFLQAYLTIVLIQEIVHVGTLYYAQRRPEELGDIAWIIDRKDRAITLMEETWTKLILPFSEARSAKEPLGKLIGADYSHFERYQIDMTDSGLRSHLEWIWETYGVPQAQRKGGVDIKRLLSEQRHFADSIGSLGLQLADMLAAILRRALNNHLAPSGWSNFGSLLVLKQRARIIALGKAGSRPLRISNRALAVCRAIDDCTQSMLTDDDSEAVAN
jgi:Protein of unknown function (DUF3800)